MEIGKHGGCLSLEKQQDCTHHQELIERKVTLHHHTVQAYPTRLNGRQQELVIEATDSTKS